MTPYKKLTPAQRDFFGKVRQAAFSNPFGEERLDLDLQIGAVSPGLDRPAITEHALAEVTHQLEELDRKGTATLAHFTGRDAELMPTVFLFEIFHLFLDDFDRHILQQVEAGDRPQPVRFAEKAMAAFYRRGFSEIDACRYLAFFFQLRRAFFFIHRDLVGDCPSMQEFRCHLWRNLFTHDIRWFENYLWNRMEDFSTLILGETGAGKGAAASAIGCSGHIPFDDKTGKFKESFTAVFIARNLSQFPESLIESELFGHHKGSFTGATGDFKGVFAQCSSHGAIFLDEIGDLSTPIQIKLLQVLQERIFSPVGSHDKQRFSGRVIAATNRPLDTLRREGTFRDDFFYRLCSDVITVPPLRQRIRENPQELDLLLQRVVERIVGERQPALAGEIRTILDKSLGPEYEWPGNVRELEQAVRRILLAGNYAGEARTPSVDINDNFLAKVGEYGLSAQEMLCDYCKVLHRRYGTYEKVAQTTGLDRRTVKKYIEASKL